MTGGTSRTGTGTGKAAAPQDFWAALRLTTQSRIGLGRAGDSLPTRHVLGLRPAPEFEQWLQSLGMVDSKGRVLPIDAASSSLRQLTSAS